MCNETFSNTGLVLFYGETSVVKGLLNKSMMQLESSLVSSLWRDRCSESFLYRGLTQLESGLVPFLWRDKCSEKFARQGSDAARIQFSIFFIERQV